jgi:hypothetical protein
MWRASDRFEKNADISQVFSRAAERVVSNASGPSRPVVTRRRQLLSTFAIDLRW